nr:MAG TPA: Polyhedrin [Caudoviricetes sp.]
MSFPQLERFFQQVTLFWDNLHRPLVFATICLHIE